MELSSSIRRMRSGARHRAELMGQGMKNRRMQGRLEHAAEENERLRTENRMLREEIDEDRADRQRILDLLEEAVSDHEDGSHAGRWLLFFAILGAAVYAWMRTTTNGGLDSLMPMRSSSTRMPKSSTPARPTGVGGIRGGATDDGRSAP